MVTSAVGGFASGGGSTSCNVAGHHIRHGCGWGRRVAFSSGFAFVAGCFCLYAFVAATYGWLTLRTDLGRSSWMGCCRDDNEGSWSVGVFYGDSPFSLKPIESVNIWRDESAAWPVSNPILTCSLVSDSGFPSNFVADPFLHVQGDTLYLFYETKDPISMQGDIGVAKSVDKGATWQPLGIALDEDWHLSYPYVFSYLGEIYMMPEGSKSGELSLYRAVNFPLHWKLEKTILKKPLVDSTMIYHDGVYWLFGSDHSGFGTSKNGQLEIWYSISPLGPWKPHKKNPIYNTNKSFGARNGGRPFFYNGNLYRPGQDCGETYGKRIRIFKVEVLSKHEYKEVEVSFPLEETFKGRNAWNGVRQHHLDVQQLSSGEWIGVIDGDRVPSGDLGHRVILGYASLVALSAVVVLLGVLLGAVNCVVPLNWSAYYAEKRTDDFLSLERANLFSDKVRRLCCRLNRVPSFIRGSIKTSTFLGRSILALMFIAGAVLACTGVRYVYGGNGASEAYQYKGHLSQFTLVTLTYDARLWNLKMYVKHYSRCSSVKEIVVIWNKGQPPKLSDLDSAVPIRVRVENENSLNNRFKIDPLIKTRGVLELDDDIMMPCDDLEKGFRVWREHPDRIVGFYPRFIDKTKRYDGEKFARGHNGYNLILTGAAFMDSKLAFERFWDEKAKEGRDLVNKYFNCEDVLLNYLYANASSSKTVEYVRPAWTIDTSKLSGVAISGNTQEHYRIRSNCVEKFSEMYGSLSDRKWEFDGRKDGWDL